MHQLDHILWEEWSLSIANERFLSLTGIKPAFGGKHKQGATQNSLLSLGKGMYFEIIAPIHSHPDYAHLPDEPPTSFSPHIVTFAMGTQDIEATRELAAKAGLDVSVNTVIRETPNNDKLKWQSVHIQQHHFGHLMPFFVKSFNKTHPSETSLTVVN